MPDHMDDARRVLHETFGFADYRPGQNVFKVQSVHNHSEIQVDAITGEVLRTDVRRSDLLEDIHDGSFFGDWAHDWVWPIVPIALMFLVFSGLWLFIEPLVRRKKRRRRREAARAAETQARP